jgi:UPF0271 protein
MKEKVFILDASGIIGGFMSPEHMNITTSSVLGEINDIKSQMAVQSALEEGILRIEEPSSEALKEVQGAIEKSGDVLRLSDVDKGLVALAVFLKFKFDLQVVTDDYSMQNILKILNIPYRSILTEGIKEIYGWIKICRGCRRKYPSNHEGDECEICGSHLYRKRIKKNPLS